MEPRPRVLVADDAPTVTLLVERALNAAGMDVVVCSDGIEALQAGLGGGFDIALLDHLMPGMLGSEVVQRWSEAGVTLPVIVLSGADDDAVVVKLLELGAVDFIRKPFNVKELLLRIRRQLPAELAGR